MTIRRALVGAIFVLLLLPIVALLALIDRQAEDAMGEAAVIAGGTLLIGLAGAAAIAQWLAQPLDRLAANAVLLGEGKFRQLAPPSSRIAEARATEEAFARMAKAIRERDEDNRDMLFQLRRFSEGVGQSPLAIFFTEPDGRISYANEALTRLTGFDLIDVMNEPPVMFWKADDAAAQFAAIQGSISSGMVWRREIASITKSGRGFDAVMTVAPIRTASGKVAGCAGILEDITERKRNQESLRKSMEEANRLARARSMMLANMSHELRTPLNAIIGFSGVVEGELFGPLGDARYRTYLRDIRQAGEHLLALVGDILDAATLEAGEIELRDETVDLKELVQAALRMIEGAAQPRGLTVTAHLDPAVIVRADPVRLRQVLLNILSNAVKYTPPGGLVEISLAAGAAGAEIRVRDSGIGIAPERLDWVQQPFARETVDAFVAKRPGVGLGLPIGKALMELHGGMLELTSAPQRGTEVTLRLPPERLVQGA
ncbi:PAS domain-containing sensor histidine kinase [Desertibaculum subflavum]|uniref:PAS domain-containing sensor histidine kinase n=1 Tax=Desertibaculum subflavum TaxID=2268458 RepID=UPI000E67588E